MVGADSVPKKLGSYDILIPTYVLGANSPHQSIYQLNEAVDNGLFVHIFTWRNNNGASSDPIISIADGIIETLTNTGFGSSSSNNLEYTRIYIGQVKNASAGSSIKVSGTNISVGGWFKSFLFKID